MKKIPWKCVSLPSEFFLWSRRHAWGYFCPSFQTLQNHFSPEVAQEAMKVNHPITQEQLLSNFLEGSTEQVGVSVTWVHSCIALTVCRSYAPGVGKPGVCWCVPWCWCDVMPALLLLFVENSAVQFYFQWAGEDRPDRPEFLVWGSQLWCAPLWCLWMLSVWVKDSNQRLMLSVWVKDSNQRLNSVLIFRFRWLKVLLRRNHNRQWFSSRKSLMVSSKPTWNVSSH